MLKSNRLPDVGPVLSSFNARVQVCVGARETWWLPAERKWRKCEQLSVSSSSR